MRIDPVLAGTYSSITIQCEARGRSQDAESHATHLFRNDLLQVGDALRQGFQRLRVRGGLNFHALVQSVLLGAELLLFQLFPIQARDSAYRTLVSNGPFSKRGGENKNGSSNDSDAPSSAE